MGWTLIPTDLYFLPANTVSGVLAFWKLHVRSCQSGMAQVWSMVSEGSEVKKVQKGRESRLQREK